MPLFINPFLGIIKYQSKNLLKLFFKSHVFLLLLILICHYLNSPSQNVNPVTLNKDTSTVLILNAEARKIVSSQPEKAFKITSKALEISKNISFNKGAALSLNGMGIASYYMGLYQNALNFYEKSLLIYKNINDPFMVSTVYANIANIHHILGNYTNALIFFKLSLEISVSHLYLERTATTLGSLGILYYDQGEYAAALNIYLKTLKIRELLNDKQGVAYTLSNIGLIYDDQAQYKKALSYYKKALALLNDLKDHNGMAATLNNMGLIYYSIEQPDTALKYFEESLIIAQKISNKIIIRSCYNNIGDIYKSSGNFKKATHYYILTQKINDELNDTKSKAITLNSIADLYKQQKEYAKAIDGFNQSLSLAEKTQDKFMIKENHKNLADVYAIIKNFSSAYEHFKTFYFLNEELFRESQRQLSEIQYQYESEKIQNEIKILKKDKELRELLIERNNLIIYTTVISIILLLIITLIIYIANRQKTKANEKLKIQNIIIAKQKEEIASEKQRADNQILEILKTQQIDLNSHANTTASIDDYSMVAALFKKMQLENTNSKIEILKSEVNPHFLFNSLNNLVGLIEENQAVAANYVQELSAVYLYVLKSKEKELVELSDEINFAKSYSFLLFKRFGNNLQLNIDIAQKFLNHYVPPLCLELLIENAVKHNIVTPSKPLRIDIFIENNYLIVKNNLQLKTISEPSTKIGLQNIEKRYAILTDKKTEIIKTKKDFIVKLPLIDLT